MSLRRTLGWQKGRVGDGITTDTTWEQQVEYGPQKGATPTLAGVARGSAGY
jgi:hypothetical protein